MVINSVSVLCEIEYSKIELLHLVYSILHQGSATVNTEEPDINNLVNPHMPHAYLTYDF